MLTNIQINFHDTFPPELAYISKILELSSQNYSGTKYDISNLTGIPTGRVRGKVIPHIKYAKFMGLIDYKLESGKYRLMPTDIGSEVFAQDKFMLENITKELCNYWITDRLSGAPQWAYLFRVFPHAYNQEISTEFLRTKANDFFSDSIEMGVVKSSYQTGCFESLDLFEWDNNVLVFKAKHSRYEAAFVYGYTLLKSWETTFADHKEITVSQIIDEIGWNKPFGFDYDEALDVLDDLADIGIILVNKQLLPATVVKLTFSNDIIGKLYSRLI